MNPHSYPFYFNPDGCLTYEGLKALHSGFPADEVQHELAAHTSLCPLCAAAAEGFSMAGEINFDENYQKLNSRLIKSSLPERSRPKSNAMIFNRFSITVTPATLKYVAAALLLLTVGTVWLISTTQVNQFTRLHLASNTQVIDPLAYPTDTEPLLTPADFLVQDIIMLPPEPPQINSTAGIQKPVHAEYPETEQQVRVVAEIMPEYIGAETDANTYFEHHNENPLLQLANLNGKVSLGFIVETDGSLSQIRILRGLSPVHDQTSVEGLVESGIWHPGIHHNHPCRVLVSLTVNFSGGVIQIKKC
ncbi:MAG: hypothetical protein RBR28_07685 [Lentimicrobium sp.]|jgi:hypothetical protein|nr:hypothetical protein [Lentimicrobium sp.]